MAKNSETTSAPWDRLGISTAPTSVIPGLLDMCFEITPKFTVCLVGETGIGKTPIVHAWCKKRGGFLRVLNFGHMSPEEISMAMFNDDGSEYDFVPPRWLLELNEKAAELGTAVLFLDECNRGDKALVNALFTLTDERRIHNFKLHDNVLVVAAMNPSDGTYLVNSMEKDHAVRKRLNFVYVMHDLAGWLRFAADAGYHKLVTSFCRARSNLFYDAAARDAGKSFACPSNWEKVSGILPAAERKKLPLTSTAVRILVEGQIGSAAGTAFLDYVRDQSTVIMPNDVLRNYAKLGRPRVARLLGMMLTSKEELARDSSSALRADVIADLSKGLALTLSNEHPPVGEVGEGLAQYLLDIPNDMYMAFWSEHMKSALGTQGDDRTYLRDLNAELRKNEKYGARVEAMMRAQRELSHSLRAE